MSTTPDEPASPAAVSSTVGLEQELRQLKEKFAEWKVKAKTGVDQLRGQVTDLQQQLTQSKLALSESEARNANLQTRLTEALNDAVLWKEKALAPRTPPPPQMLPQPVTDEAEVAALNGRVSELEAELHALQSSTALEASDRRQQHDLEMVAMTTKSTLLTNAWNDAVKHMIHLSHAAVTALGERAEAARETEKVKAELDKFKARSSKSLHLATQRAEDLTAKLEAAEQAVQRTAELHASLATKDRTIAAVESRLHEAQQHLSELALQRDVLDEELRDARSGGSMGHRRSASRRDDHHDADDAALRDAVSAAEASAELRLREELEALSSAHREEMEQKNLEIAQLTAKLAAQAVKHQQASSNRGGVIASWFGAAAVDSSPVSNPDTTDTEAADDAYVQVLRAQLEQARNDADELRLERDQLASQVRRLHGKVEVLTRASSSSSTVARGVSGSSSNGAAADATVVALADCSPDELRRHLAVKSEQLWDANQQVLQLRAALKSATSHQLTGRGTLGGDGGETQQQQQQRYLRSVLVNFLTAKSDDVRAGLIPVFATLLRLTADELKATYTANPDWIA